MCVEHRNLTWALVLLFLSGALCTSLDVKYQLGHICAVKGSSVVIPCSFSYPNDHKVKEVMWGHEKYNIYDGPFLFSSTNTTSRFQYIGDKEHNCSFLIHQVENSDTGKYAFRFITDKDKFTGIRGSTLKVVDLNVSLTKPSGSRSLKEGDSVNLTCITGCDGGHLSSLFTWLKNGEAIQEGPVLYLSNMSSTSSGNYSCSLKTTKIQRATASEVMNIDVEYGPKNTSIISLKEVNGSSYFKLICTSKANPPVENYTWFKIYKNDHAIVGHQSVISLSDGGWYFCTATNKHGSQNSTVNPIEMIKEPFNRVLLLIPAVAVLLIVTTVIVIARLDKKRTRAPETNCEEDIQNTVYANWPVTDTNRSQETSPREETTVEVIYTTVDFHTKRESNMEQQMDSHPDDESVVYSTVCRKQVWSPSYIETL